MADERRTGPFPGPTLTSFRRVDGKPGTGDRATITVMKDRRALPF